MPRRKEPKRPKATYTDGVKPDGSPNRIYFYGATTKEARAKRDEYKYKCEHGMVIENKSMTVAEWLIQYIKLYAVNLEYSQQYYNHLKDDIGRMPIANVREAHLYKTLSDRYNGKTRGSAIQYRAFIKKVFKKARVNKVIAEDPSEDLQLPDNIEDGKSHRRLTNSEIETIFSTSDDYLVSRWALIMMLAGLRRGEMMALQWSDIDMEERTINVNKTGAMRAGKYIISPQTKTDAGMRLLPICEKLYAELSKTPVNQRNGYVCLADEKQITPYLAEKLWARYAELIADESGSSEKIRMHDLRHTYATILYEAGVDIKSAQYYMGHKTITMTLSLYTHLSEEHERINKKRLTNHLNSWIETLGNEE